jgi:hypothetical protein
VVQIKTLHDSQALATIMSSEFGKYLMPRKEGVYLKLPTNTIPLLNESLIQSNIAVIGIETKNSLEDYFLQITSNAL